MYSTVRKMCTVRTVLVLPTMLKHVFVYWETPSSVETNLNLLTVGDVSNRYI